MNINSLNQKNLKDKSSSKENGWFLKKKNRYALKAWSYQCYNPILQVN